MTASVYINGSRLRQRLLEQRLSDREFCRQTGLGKNRGTIEFGSGKDSRYRLTPNAAYAFDVPPEPAGSATGTRAGHAR